MENNGLGNLAEDMQQIVTTSRDIVENFQSIQNLSKDIESSINQTTGSMENIHTAISPVDTLIVNIIDNVSQLNIECQKVNETCENTGKSLTSNIQEAKATQPVEFFQKIQNALNQLNATPLKDSYEALKVLISNGSKAALKQLNVEIIGLYTGGLYLKDVLSSNSTMFDGLLQKTKSLIPAKEKLKQKWNDLKSINLKETFLNVKDSITTTINPIEKITQKWNAFTSASPAEIFKK
ncbi:MAG: hypothetical protein LIP01_11035 [Tannerellaceae bacterium]|nr:hypothetical protein [Tannerellaceae bacterium]